MELEEQDWAIQPGDRAMVVVGSEQGYVGRVLAVNKVPWGHHSHSRSVVVRSRYRGPGSRLKSCIGLPMLI